MPLHPSLIASSETTEPFSGNQRRFWILVLCLLCAFLITLQAWSWRFFMNPDGVSYLDMASILLHGDLRPLLHPYWSPLYPCLLAAVLRLFPGPAMEFQAAHLANWLIALAALATFTLFIHQYLKYKSLGRSNEPAAAFRCRTGLAYGLFLWAMLEAIGLGQITPDLCVAALVFLALALCYRLQLNQSHSAGVLLGLVLALASLTKAAMVPLSCLLLVLLAVKLRKLPQRRAILLATLCFALVLVPYVFALSRQQGHLTFGEAGRLNYAWLVQGGIPAHVGWIGQPATFGTPVHPPLLLAGSPSILIFQAPVPGTFPPWYNPAYFHQGLRVQFNLGKQITAIAQSLKTLRWTFGSSIYPLLAGLMILGCYVSPRRVWQQLSHCFIVYWSLAALAMYALVSIQPRYIAAFAVALWIAGYDAFTGGQITASRRGTVGVVAACLLLMQINATIKQKSAADATPLAAANQLSSLGLRPGDQIATLGDGFDDFYARLARLRIVACINFNDDPGSTTHSLNDRETDAIKAKLQPLHIRAIVGQAGQIATTTDWHCSDDTGYCVLLLE